MRKITLITLTVAALPFAVQAANTEFSYGGFIKADASITKYEHKARIAYPGFYIPGQTPTADATGVDNDLAFDQDIRQSRFNLGTKTTLDNGEEIKTFIEIDFLGSVGASNVSNPHAPRLRHAFLTYNNLTVGQTWSTFMNVGALPESVDLIGPSDGTVFIRQNQIRYTMGDLQLALEQANTTSEGVKTTATVPDAIARYNLKAADNVNLSAAAMLRRIEAWDVDKAKTGFGVNVAGVIGVGEKDNIKFSASYGSVHNYVGVGLANPFEKAGASDDLNKITAGFVSYQHFWDSKLRSTLTYSMLSADVEKSSSARVNLLYSPVEKLTYGAEFSHAQLDNGAKGKFDRLEATIKYAF